MAWAARVLLALMLSFTTTTLATPPKAPDAPVYVPVHTEDDICIAWVLHDEARGEPLRGQRAVYDVVKRRMKKRNLTACEVVKQPYQFSGYKRGMELAADEDMLQRLSKVRKIPPVAPNASYFHSKQVKPSWKDKMKRVLSIGNHVFYVKPQTKEKQK